MTEFEKLVVETPITMDCFEMDDFEDINYDNSIHNISYDWKNLIKTLEQLRNRFNWTKDEKYLKELIRLLPNTYRVRKGNIQYEFREVKCHKMI